jgi:multidrug resistance efflux pump
MKEGNMKRVRLAVIILITVAIVSTGIWLGIKTASKTTNGDISTSGFIEARDVSLAFEVSGRITEIAASEGDQVKAGSTIVKLDETLLRAQQKQSQAAIEQAQAAVTQATLARDQAAVARDNARKSLDLALDIQKHPLTLEASVIAAQGQVSIAESSLLLATDNFRKMTYPYSYTTVYYDVPEALADISDASRILTAALTTMKAPGFTDNTSTITLQLQHAIDSLTKSQELLARRGYGEDLFAGKYLSMDQYWTVRAAQLQMDQAQSVLNTATRTLQNVMDVKNNPQQINTAVQGAQTAYDGAISAVNSANNSIVMAQIQMEQSTAALKVLEVQIGKLSLTAPISGMITAKNSEVGEIAQAGAPILTIVDMATVTLTAYVPESKIGLVKIGQEAAVSVDSYPGENFPGKVIYISPQAQFTPRDVQLKDEREKTVFAIKINLNNLEQKLKPGMPADARIQVN